MVLDNLYMHLHEFGLEAQTALMLVIGAGDNADEAHKDVGGAHDDVDVYFLCPPHQEAQTPQLSL